MFTSNPIIKGIFNNTPTSRSAWGKANIKSIDMLGNSCIRAIAYSDLTPIQFTTGA